MPYVNPQKAVEYLRSKDPYDTAYLTDREVYELAQQKYPDYDYPSWEADVPVDIKEPAEKRESLRDMDTSPGTLGKLATMSVADMFADDSKYWADTYNKSSAGLLYQSLYGKAKYDPEHYEPELLGEIGQFFLGHLAPLDALIFFGSGGLGSATAGYVGKKFLTNWGLKGLAAASTTKAAEKVFARDMIIKAGIQSGLGLGAYGAAGGTLAETAKQSKEMRDGLRDEFDLEEIVWNASKSGLQSAAIGAVSGGLVRGPMGTKYGFAKLKGTDRTFKDKVTMAYANPLGQVAAEAHAFTAGEFAFSDEKLNMKNFYRGVARNFFILGGLRVLAPGSWSKQGEDIARLEKQTRGFIKEGADSDVFKRAAESYNESLGKDPKNQHDIMAEKALLEKSAEKDIQLLEQLGGYEKLGEIHKKLSKIAREIDPEEAQRIINKVDKEGFESLTAEEKLKIDDIDYWLHESNAYNNVMLGLYEDYLRSPEKYLKLLEAERPTKEPLTEQEQKRAMSSLENARDELLEFSDFTNALARGDKPTKLPKDVRFKTWMEKGMEDTTGDRPKTPVTTKELDAIQAKILEVSGKMAKPPSEIKEMEEFQIRGASKVEKTGAKEYTVFDVEGNPLEKTYKTKKGADGALNKLRSQSLNLTALETWLVGKAPGVTFVSHEKFKAQSHEDFGVSAKRKKNLIEPIDKKVEDKYIEGTTEEVNNFENSKGVIRNIIQEHLIREVGGPGGRKGAGIFGLKPEKIDQHVSSMVNFAEFLAKRGRNFSNATIDDVKAFLRNKKEVDANSYNYLQEKYLDHNNPELKGLNAKTVMSYTRKVPDALQGARASQVNSANETITVFPSKGTQPTSAEVVISKPFTKILKNVIEYNKNNIPKERLEWQDIDGIVHDFLFWKENKTPLTHEDAAKFFKHYSGKGKFNIHGAPEINIEMFRKGLQTYVSETYPNEPRASLIVDALKTLHKRGDQRQFYDIIGEEGKTRLKELTTEYAELIFGDTAPKVQKGAKNYATPYEFWLLTQNIKAYPSEYLKFGTDYISKEHALAFVRYGIETSQRWTDIAPETNAFFQRLLKYPYLKDKLPVGKKIKSGQDRSTILTWERGTVTQNKSNRNKYIKAKFKIDKEQLSLEKANEKFNSKIVENKAKLQELPIGKPSTEAAINKLLQRETKKNPGLKTWVNESKENKEYAGKFHDGLIELTLGKANEHTFFHENSHRFKEFVNKIGNKELSSLIERGEKMFANEAKKTGQSAEEYFTDRMADYGTGMSKGVISKMKNWGKLMVSKLKKYIFGTDKLKKEDIARLLGAEVYKGFDTRGIRKMGKTPKFKFEDEVAATKYTRSDFHKKMNALGLKGETSSKDKMMRFIAELGDIENVSDFINVLKGKIGAYEGYMEDINKFHHGMAEINIPKLSNIAEKVKWFSNFKEVERLRIKPEINIGKEQLIADMKSIGVKSGNIWDATPLQLEKYLSFVKTIDYADKPRIGWLEQAANSSNLNSKLAGEMPAWTYIKGRTAPVHVFLESIGLEKLSNKLITHAVREMKRIGEGFDSFENDAKKISGRTKWAWWKNYLWTLDRKRYEDALAEGTLKKGEINFIKNAVDDNWKPRMETKQGRLANRYKKFTKYYKDEFVESIRQIMPEAEFEKFMDGDNIKWIEDGFYVSRILTKEFKKKYNMNSKHIEEYVHDETVKLAAEEAIKKYGTAEVSNEQIKEFMEASEGVVRASIYDMMNLSTTKVSSRFLKRRHLKLPERIGKIKVYETGYESTMKVYANSMSKFLANIEVFPEYVSMKGFDFPGVKAEIQKVRTAHGKWGNYVVDAVERQVGLGRGDPFQVGASFGQATANTLAKLGLSFPTAGLKNVLLGTTQTLGAFRMRDSLEGFVKTLDAVNRESVRKTGATQMGLRHFEGGVFSRTLDATVFKFGMMKPTENFNRYLSVLTSRVEQGRLVNIIRNKHTERIDGKKHENAMRRLKDFYKMSEEELTLLKKYGMEGADGHKLSPYDLAVETRKMQNIYQKMDSMAHINTQGASMSLFMPEWWGKAGIKPLTLYKRMALAATTNTFRNTKIAWKNKELMRLFMFTGGTFLSGEILMGAYDALLGVKPPSENSPWWRQIMTILWRGEMLGILSEAFSPFFGSGWNTSIYPAIYNNGLILGDQVFKLSKGYTDIGLATKDYTRRTFSLWNNTMKAIESRTNKYDSDSRRWRKLHREYEKEVNAKPDPVFSANTMTPHYRRLKETFNKGTEKEFARQYIITLFTKATEMFNEGYNAEGIPVRSADQAFKEAYKIIETMITNMNPNPASLDKSSEIAERRSLQFLQWIKTGMGEDVVRDIFKTEAEYLERKDRYKAALPYNLRQFNLEEIAKKYLKPEKKKSIKDRKSMYIFN